VPKNRAKEKGYGVKKDRPRKEEGGADSMGEEGQPLFGVTGEERRCGGIQGKKESKRGKGHLGLGKGRGEQSLSETF